MDNKMYTKEELIGRKFRVESSGETYDILRQVGNDIYYKNIRPEFSRTHQPLSTFIEQLEKGCWKLLSEETKMYKTPKGIEYGVGTQFTTSSMRDNEPIVHTITKIDEELVYISIPGYNTTYPVRVFPNNLDRWEAKIITPMKDYKQVDPKTITFDFTNTKIKVNNEDESKWIQEVAFNNKWKWADGNSFVQYKDNPALEFSTISKGIFRMPILFSFKDSSYKEITIQDILNQNNMKEVIEVGDVVGFVNKSLMGEKRAIIKEVLHDKDKPAFRLAHGGWEYLHNLHLVSKGKKKEIIGYETVVDLPGIPKGTKSSKYDIAGARFNFKQGSFSYDQEALNDTKFFKPIYKADSIEVKFSKHTATLSKENGLVFSDGEKLTLGGVKQILSILDKPVLQVEKFKVNILPQFINVGCKQFTTDDVLTIKQAIKKLDE